MVAAPVYIPTHSAGGVPWRSRFEWIYRIFSTSCPWKDTSHPSQLFLTDLVLKTVWDTAAQGGWSGDHQTSRGVEGPAHTGRSSEGSVEGLQSPACWLPARLVPNSRQGCSAISLMTPPPFKPQLDMWRFADWLCAFLQTKPPPPQPDPSHWIINSSLNIKQMPMCSKVLQEYLFWVTKLYTSCSAFRKIGLYYSREMSRSLSVGAFWPTLRRTNPPHGSHKNIHQRWLQTKRQT